MISNESSGVIEGGFIEEPSVEEEGGGGLVGVGAEVSPEGFGGVGSGFIEEPSVEEEGGGGLVGVEDEVSKDFLIVGHGRVCEDDSRDVADTEGAS